jgi:dTDP-4-amino-4,6-dideoxygalactose transaminase
MIKFNRPYLTGREQAYIADVFRNEFFAGNGPFTKRVHALLEQRYAVPHVLLTHSCTAALEMAALLHDCGPGDEVIVPSYTFTSTASAFLRTGAKIVFCEVGPGTMTVDIEDVLRRVTPRTKVVVPIHYGGISADIDSLREALPARVAIVEDAAQGLNAKYRGRWVGTLAPLAAISFHETKNLHCGLGGALFVNDASFFERAEDIWERGTDRSKLFRGLVDKYSWVELGSSFYPSELQAAFLLAQLEAIEDNARERRVIYDAYVERFATIEARGWLSLPRPTWELEHNAHAYFIVCRNWTECDGLRMHLSKNGAEAYIGYVPLHASRVGARLGYRPEDLPVTLEYAGRVLRLPLHNRMSVADVDTVYRDTVRFFEGGRDG